MDGFQSKGEKFIVGFYKKIVDFNACNEVLHIFSVEKMIII